MSATIDLQDPTAVHEAVVEDRLQTLRDEFYVLTINWDHVRDSRRTGEQIAPAHACICPNCSEKTETILYGGRDIEDALFCDSCFDDAHRAEIEGQLAAEVESC